MHPFDICNKNPIIWQYIKLTFIITYFFSNIILSNFLFNTIFINISSKKFNINKSKTKNKNKIKIKDKKINNHNYECKSKKNKITKLNLLIGEDLNKNIKIFIPESGLYQNFLITGTIGSGKTSSAMYPFTKQLLKYNSENIYDKIGMLILDVKGNYCKQVINFAKQYNLENDLIIISLTSNNFYNPLHKPNLKPIVLANRLKTILTLFSENNSESYWLDKAEQILCEAIKLCRLYNENYVTFSELHKLITIPDYYKDKIKILKDLFIKSKFNTKQIYELNECLNFFQKEFENLDSRTKGILVSEITRITNTFISDYDVFSTFCPPRENLKFLGF